MRAHRLVHPDKGRFWEVHWEGLEAETTAGVLGTNGRSTSKAFATPRETDAWVEQQLGKKRKEGFVELTQPGQAAAPPSADLGALLEQIIARPDDDGLRAVYADQLSASGDARGEFINVQLQLQRAPTPMHQHRERELLERFRVAWSQGLRGVDLRYERGFVAEAHLRFEELEQHAARLWVVAPLLSRLHVNTDFGSRAAEALAAVLAQPGASRLRELHLNFLHGGPVRVTEALRADALAGLVALSIRRLGLTDVEWLDLLGERFAHLVRVDVRNNVLSSASLSALVRRPLRALDFRNNRLGESSAQALARVPQWRGLERLVLSGNGIGNAGLRVLAGAEDLVALKSLGLSEVRALPSGIEALGKAAFAAQLESLELSGNDLRAEGVRAVLGGAFPALTSLDLSEAMLGDEGLAALLDSPGAARLTELELKKNAISTRGAERLAAARLPSLTALNLSGNPLGDAGIDALKRAYPGIRLNTRGGRLDPDA